MKILLNKIKILSLIMEDLFVLFGAMPFDPYQRIFSDELTNIAATHIVAMQPC